jgi:hypothetical protein
MKNLDTLKIKFKKYVSHHGCKGQLKVQEGTLVYQKHEGYIKHQEQ